MVTSRPADPPRHAVRAAVGLALAEDLTPLGDLSAALIPPGTTATATLASRAEGVFAGRACVDETFAQVDEEVRVEWLLADGAPLAAGTVAARVSGPLASILTGERTALNFARHLSGVATLTRRFVEAVGADVLVWDTRKTIPGLRSLEKAAVRAGGGANHRGNLSDWVMLKDNHLAVLDVATAVARAREVWPGRTIHVECDTVERAVAAAEAGADALLLDNLGPEDAAKAVAAAREALGGRRCLIEASGGITLETVKTYAGTGVDAVSAGALTDSARALDLGLDVDTEGVGLMLLAVDAGNTDTVIGLYDLSVTDPKAADDGLVDHWRIATHAERTADEHAVMFEGFLSARRHSGLDEVEGLVISSGVPRVMANLRNMANRYLGKDPVVLEPGVRTGVAIRTDNPKEVGADRIANAVAAFDLYGGPTIMVDFGTATTCDAVSADGEYLGGAIAPGVEISLDALVGRAAALRQVDLVEPRSVLGRSTVESIQSGIVYGYAAQVDGLCARIEAELGECSVVGTGGLSPLIAPFTDSIEHVEPWLTLHGLRLVHAMNAEE